MRTAPNPVTRRAFAQSVGFAALATASFPGPAPQARFRNLVGGRKLRIACIGVFIRSSDIVNWPHNPIEAPTAQGNGAPVHVVGALFEVTAPSRRVPITPDQSYRYTITARDSRITGSINGEKVNKVDLNQRTEPGLNSDGTKNKFSKAMAREGRGGFQDHGGYLIEFRNLLTNGSDSPAPLTL